jgi:hypothetical protein
VKGKYFQPITFTAPKITTTTEIDLTLNWSLKKSYIIMLLPVNIDPFHGSGCYSYPSEKLDDKILRKYVRQYIDDIFVEFGEKPSIHLILINIDTRQYFFNIFQ